MSKVASRDAVSGGSGNKAKGRREKERRYKRKSREEREDFSGRFYEAAARPPENKGKREENFCWSMVLISTAILPY